MKDSKIHESQENKKRKTYLGFHCAEQLYPLKIEIKL